MNYLWTKYLFYKFIDDEKIYLYNFRNGKDFFLSKEEFETKKFKDDNEFHFLVSNEFLVDSNVDELSEYIANAENEVLTKHKLELTIIPTDACNFRCVYCYETKESHRMSEESWDILFQYVYKQLPKLSMLIINWFGGEPLLCSNEVIKFMNSCKAACKEFRVLLFSTMTTNAYLLSTDVFNGLVRSGVYFFQITVDGLEHTHNRQRPLKSGAGSFEKIISNLRNIKKSCKFPFIQIVIRVNISKKIIRDFESFLNFFEKNFGEDKRFILYIEKVQDWGGEDIKSFKCNMPTDKNYIMAWEMAAEKEINVPEFFKYSHEINVCAASRENGFIVNWDLTLHKCTLAMYDLDTDIRLLNCIGKIKSDGVAFIDRGKQKTWVGIKKDLSKCQSCKFLPQCYAVGCSYRRVKGIAEDCRKEDLNSICMIQFSRIGEI